MTLGHMQNHTIASSFPSGPVCRYKKVNYSQGSVLHLHKCTLCTCSMRGNIPVFRCKNSCIKPGNDHHTSPGIGTHTAGSNSGSTSPIKGDVVDTSHTGSTGYAKTTG